MGQWSKVNTSETWMERTFGKGKEDPVAAYRRQLRNGSDTSGLPADELPDTRRNGRRMSRKEARAMDKVLREGKQKRERR